MGETVEFGTHAGIKVIERQWDDGYHTFYQAKAQGRSGLIFEQTIIEGRWGPSRAVVYENVRRAAEGDRSSQVASRFLTTPTPTLSGQATDPAAREGTRG